MVSNLQPSNRVLNNSGLFNDISNSTPKSIALISLVNISFLIFEKFFFSSEPSFDSWTAAFETGFTTKLFISLLWSLIVTLPWALVKSS